MLAWLGILINLAVRWLDCEQSVKPIYWCVFPYIMINPTGLPWMIFIAPLAMYESSSVPLFLEEIMPISEVAVLLRD